MQPQADPFIVPPCHEDIEILFQDEHLLLINKPTKLLSLSGKHPENIDSVHYRLVQDYPTATLLHRLDFGTSGIMIAALNKSINAQIGKQFQMRTIEKSYIALLHGHLSDSEGMIDYPIAKDAPNFPLQKICYDEGKPAQSYFCVEEYLHKPDRTRVRFTPKSGRTHQLRIHSQKMGHAILGCDLYASNEAFHMADRLMLHASSITFDHPISHARMTFKSPCPF